MTNDIRNLLAARILLLDGGFGTMVQGYGLDEADYRGERFRDWNVQLKGCNDLLVLTRPDTVREIHEKYLQAGADIITTDSFNANAVSLADYGLEPYACEIARAAASVARAAADAFTARNPQKPRFVAGSMGPTNRTASMSADVANPASREVTFRQLADAYRDQAQLPRRKAEHGGYVSIETFDCEPPVVERICALIDRGFRPSDIMILVRSATDGAKVAAALLDFKQRNTEARYRFDVMTQEALIVGSAPISSFVAAALRLALNTDDRLSRAVCNHYLGRPFDAPLSDDEREFFHSIRLESPEEAFERIVMRFDLRSDRSQIAYLQALHEQEIAFCSSKIADIALFLRWWDEQGQNRSLSVEQSASTVEITTIHKAKGLEKRAVIIPYCSWQLDPKSGGVQNIVWAEARGDGEAEAIGRFPVRYKRSMAESGFSAEYYRELVYAHVDNVNLLYVALTRAAESLHVFIPRKTGRTVGALLLGSLRPGSEGQVFIGETEGRCLTDERGEHYLFGSFEGPVAGGRKESDAEHVVLEEYPTARPALKLRLPSQRYFEEGGEPELAPRNLGILMHRAFEQADDAAQVREAVAHMQADGILSEEDAARLRQRIDRAFELPEVREWFDGSWQRIRNEQEIIVPGSASTRRPDRVMIRGTRVVVVDYKFGALDTERHRRQVAEYLRLLAEMGYDPVEGYLWYVKLGRIERVEG